MPTSLILLCAALAYFGVRLVYYVRRTMRKQEVENEIGTILHFYGIALHLVIGLDMVSETKDTIIGITLVGIGFFHLILYIADTISFACRAQHASGTRYVM